MRQLRYLPLSIVIGIATVSCSPGKVNSPTARLISSVHATRNSGSALMTIDFDEIAGSSVTSIHFSGYYSFNSSIGELTTQSVAPELSPSSTSVPLPENNNAANGQSSESVGSVPVTLLTSKVILTANRYLVSIPTQLAQFSGGKKWASISLSSLNQLSHAAGLSSLQAVLDDPRFWWTLLNGVSGKLKLVGSGLVDGFKTRLFSQKVNLLKSSDDPGPYLSVLDGAVSGMGTGLVPMQVAIDKHGLIRQASISFTFPIESQSTQYASKPSLSQSGSSIPPSPTSTGTTTSVGPSSVQLDVVLTFPSFGVPVNVKIPSSSEITSLNSIISAGSG